MNIAGEMMRDWNNHTEHIAELLSTVKTIFSSRESPSANQEASVSNSAQLIYEVYVLTKKWSDLKKLNYDNSLTQQSIQLA